MRFSELRTRNFELRVALFPPVSPVSLRGLRDDMLLSDHLSITAPLESKKHAGERANLDRVGEGINSGSRDDAVGSGLLAR